MPFSTSIEAIREKIAAKEKRQRRKDEKLIVKYRSVINDRLRSMSTAQENVFFPNGKIHLLEQIAEELVQDGFSASIHHHYLSYPEGVRIIIQIPAKDQ